MKRFTLGLAFLALTAFSIYKIIQYYTNPERVLYYKLYWHYLSLYEMDKLKDANIINKIDLIKSNIALVIRDSIDINNKDFISKLKELTDLVEPSKKDFLLSLIEKGQIDKVINEFNKYGFDINSFYADICLNTPIDQQTDKMREFIKAFDDYTKAENINLKAFNNLGADFVLGMFFLLAMASVVISLCSITYAIKDKSDPLHAICNPLKFDYFGLNSGRNKKLKCEI